MILWEAVLKICVRPACVSVNYATWAYLSVTGMQELECRVAHLRVLCTFVIAGIETTEDGLVSWDLLQKLGAVVDVAQDRVMFSKDLLRNEDFIKNGGPKARNNNAMEATK